MKAAELGGPCFEILAEGPFRRNQVLVEYVDDHDLDLDETESRFVDRAWQRRKQETNDSGVKLFDGALWRVGAYQQDALGLHLFLGKTSYRAYVGTRQPSFFANGPCYRLANPLAICCTVVTADGRIVVARRSGVDVAVGEYSVPGGFVERGKDADSFVAMARELNEELGLEVDANRLLCTGLIYDLWHPHFELCFTAYVDVSFASLSGVVPLEQEHGHLESIADNPAALRRFLARWHNRMAPSGEACLLLHGRLSLSD